MITTFKRLKDKLIILSITISISFSGGFLFSINAQQVGQIFPSWSEGYMDIHHINTGKGESTLFILPDGTTMLVDAGATARPKPRVTDQTPDDRRTPGEWISRYILHMLKRFSEIKLHYILLTHYHGDHIGDILPGSKTSESGGYKLAGVTEVGDIIPFDKIIDRGWDYPSIPTAQYFNNYTKFVNWHITNNGVMSEQFRPGINDQIFLVNDPGRYPGFEVRNIAANGVVWTATGNNTRNHFPSLESLSPSEFPSENMCSIAFRLSYGKFNYFNGGDIIAGPSGHWRDIETPVGHATGPVDVCVANHHAFHDAMSTSFLESVRPRVHIILSWAPSHPSHSSIARMMSGSIYPGPRDVFSTNVMEETRVVIGGAIDNMKSQQGHIVVRVSPGGDSYRIFILDDSQESFKINSIHGPYLSN
jgi:beta-lactamase superfamily II metal-dependent hydrolase